MKNEYGFTVDKTGTTIYRNGCFIIWCRDKELAAKLFGFLTE